LLLAFVGCLDDPQPLKPDLGSACVGGIGGRSIRNVGRVAGLVLNTMPGGGTWWSPAFSLGGPTSLSTLTWHPRGPYGRPLANDPPFDRDRVTLTNNVFLAHFAESAGNVYADSSSSGLSLQCPPSAMCPGHGQGRFGGGVTFTGNGAVLSAPRSSPSPLEPQHFTVEAWARVSGPPASGDTSMMIVTKGVSASPPYTEYSLEWDPNGGHARCYAGLPLQAPLIGQAALPMNQWFHLACTWDGVYLRLYTNGEADGSVTMTGATLDYSSHFTEQELLIGRWGQNGTQRMVGDIDEVAVFSEALDASVIESHYLRGALSFQIQVRSCDALTNDDCPGDFVGPDGTSGSAFDESCDPVDDSGDRALPLSGYDCSGGNHDGGTSLAVRAFVQYQALLGSDSATVSPEITDVRLCH
jgi:hypothetical protein